MSRRLDDEQREDRAWFVLTLILVVLFWTAIVIALVFSNVLRHG